MAEDSSWKIGNVKVTCVAETSGAFPPGMIFVGLKEDQVKAVEWLAPDYSDKAGNILYSTHAYIVESQGRKIIVDTCIGNDKKRNNPAWDMLKLPFLERMREVGCPAASIDYVLCTHMHLDHVGWNTRWDGKSWVPTFPNARYLFARSEWEFFNRKDHGAGDMPEFVVALAEMDQVVADSVTPIAQAGLHQLIESGHKVTDEVSLIATPGHTPGHVSVRIRSGGEEAVITGDIFHNPIQIADPEIMAYFDFDRNTALETRRKFTKDHSDKDVLIFGTHFNAPSAGRIVKERDAWRFVPLKQAARKPHR